MVIINPVNPACHNEIVSLYSLRKHNAVLFKCIHCHRINEALFIVDKDNLEF